MKLDHIRNFCIVAHIDHGKSTLADRLIEATGTLQKREMKEQVLDTLDLERERGITIKLNAVRMTHTAANGEPYELNLIDTPGHVDFTYEVSRSLAACEGAILVVDASQGIQAQTLSNLFLALDAGLEIIPVLNKIDLPGAEPERRKQEVHDLIGARPEEILLVSAKEGLGIDDLLEAIVARVPAPSGSPDAPLRALIFDSYYDRYRGAVASVRVVDGSIRPGMLVKFAAGSGDSYLVAEVGYNQLRQVEGDVLGPGEVGYVVANVRTVRETRAGDTILDASAPPVEALPGYKDVHSMVFAGLYPTDTTNTRRCATRSRSSSSTTLPCTTSRRRPPRSASDSAAGFSGCFTWRSYRSGSSASSTWLSLPPCRTSSTTCTTPTVRWSCSRARPSWETPASSLGSRSRTSKRASWRRRTTSARS